MDREERQKQIRDKGFNMTEGLAAYRTADPEEYKKIRVGMRTLEDAILNLGAYSKLTTNGKRFISKEQVLKALITKDMNELRYISNLFYDINGMYERVCNYFAFLYRYDWYIAPEIFDNQIKEERVLKDFAKVLSFFDKTYVKKICGDIALSVVKEGCYYGYIVPSNEQLILQQLPVKYCRSKISVGGLPVVEFDMRFFDTFQDVNYRMKMLKLFPDEFSRGYVLYKQGKLMADERTPGLAYGSWYMLDPEMSVKFNFNNSDIPIFVNAIPAIMELEEAQDLDRRKQMQQLLKIIIQKLPMDKNGDLIFDVDESRDIHNNAVQMLSRAIGVDILTTFADIDSIDLSDKNTTATTDDLKKVERTVFNSLGISQNLFNTEGNLSLDRSILNDESTVRNLLLQYNIFFNRVLQSKTANLKKYHFTFYMLETTQYNYKDLSKLYKEQTQLGYSKMLPQIALGHSQSFILNSAFFENQILHLSEIMIPPLMSSTMNGDTLLGKNGQSDRGKSQETVKAVTEDKTAGRPEKPDSEKSEKTIQNLESMS